MSLRQIDRQLDLAIQQGITGRGSTIAVKSADNPVRIIVGGQTFSLKAGDVVTFAEEIDGFHIRNENELHTDNDVSILYGDGDVKFQATLGTVNISDAVEVENKTGDALAIENKTGDNLRVSVIGNLPVYQNYPTAASDGSTSCSATSVTLIQSLDYGRQNMILQNYDDENDVFIVAGGSAVNADRGIKLAAGATIGLDVKAPISIMNRNTSAVVVGWLRYNN